MKVARTEQADAEEWVAAAAQAEEGEVQAEEEERQGKEP